MQFAIRALQPNRNGYFLALLMLGLMGFVARAFLVLHSVGSNDIRTWQSFGDLIHAQGVGYAYDHVELFNHPPLMGYLASLAHFLSTKTGVRFEVLFKIPQLVADAAVAWLVLYCWSTHSKIYRALAFAFYCLNPLSLLISAYHGNTDALCATLCLASAFLMDRGRPGLAGLALGASINVKLIPILIVPALLVSAKDLGERIRFLGALAFCGISFAPFVLGHWAGFYAHVLAYRSYPGSWGVTAFSTTAQDTAAWAHLAVKCTAFYTQFGSIVVLLTAGTTALLALIFRLWNARELAALTLTLFLSLTPGFGVQYLVYPIPLLFSVNLPRAVVCSFIAGAFAFLLYFGLWTGGHPFFSDFNYPFPRGAFLVGILAWASFVRTALALLRYNRLIASTALFARCLR